MQSTDLVTPLALQTPIAINGNKNIPSQSASGGDTSSIDEGFLPITSEAIDDGGVAPERVDFNGMFYLSTDQRVYLQCGGRITFDSNVSTAIGGYPKGAVLDYIDSNGNYSLVKSLIDDNTNNFLLDSTLIDGVHWEEVFIGSKYRFDGQWIKSYVTLSTASATGTRTLNFSSYLPNDNYLYEVELEVNGLFTSYNATTIEIDGCVFLTSDSTGEGYMANSANGLVVVPSSRTLSYVISGASASSLHVRAKMYRRIGTNV